MADKKYHQGHDIKSLLINLATIICFILPVAIYIDRENTQNFCMAAAGGIALAILAPPVGLYRPHPYSDWEGNKPWPRRE
mmetsp:Transcript_14811/g.22433  ORF Transcript_14811/g.22433 Transcript_14811/m.22433 type:complete len:80 (-) Transcript_14811:399-638(-)